MHENPLPPTTCAFSRLGRSGGVSTLLCGLLVAAASGCSVSNLATADRYAKGLLVILPGIEGRSVYNVSLARGLDAGRVPEAIEIFDWGVATPAGFLVNLTALERNKRQAEKLARRISNFQVSFPHRPVHIFAHSGGGGIALLTLESLEPDQRVTAVYLLGAAISPDYDLTEALEHTDLGIWNFYSPRDVSFLTVGTSLFGTIDRRHTASAGAVGFRIPEELDEPGRTLYARKLHQAPYNTKMYRAGSDGSHLGWVNERFARNWLAPMVLADVRAVRKPHYSSTAVVRAENHSRAASLSN